MPAAVQNKEMSSLSLRHLRTAEKPIIPLKEMARQSYKMKKG